MDRVCAGHMQVTNWLRADDMQVMNSLCVVCIQGMCRFGAGCMQIMS